MFCKLFLSLVSSEFIILLPKGFVTEGSELTDFEGGLFNGFGVEFSGAVSFTSGINSDNCLNLSQKISVSPISKTMVAAVCIGWLLGSLIRVFWKYNEFQRPV